MWNGSANVRAGPGENVGRFLWIVRQQNGRNVVRVGHCQEAEPVAFVVCCLLVEEGSCVRMMIRRSVGGGVNETAALLFQCLPHPSHLKSGKVGDNFSHSRVTDPPPSAHPAGTRFRLIAIQSPEIVEQWHAECRVTRKNVISP
jgi:hypothetical protein